MERRLKITEDGSHTIYVRGLDEPYHSTHGAFQESMHVFIKQGLLTVKQPSVRILELGFGTGLNALLTFAQSIPLKLDIFYHAVEKYPLMEHEYKLLNYEKLVEHVPKGTLDRIHSCPWGEPVQISDRFTLYKEEADFRSMKLSPNINLAYFDAFSPDKQPELWTPEIMGAIGRVSDTGAILVTYSSKGIVRRALNSCGFDVLKVAGPPGKREMIRAIKR
jgi:tRNA U34 5-methylaminomethyl-2-thiouridine-forming methyltransferase MnmC